MKIAGGDVNNCCPADFTDHDFASGDYVAERTAGGHPRRHASRKLAADTLVGQGTQAAFVDLPTDRKIRGNSHLMMMDDNSDELAGLIEAWLKAGGASRD